MNKNKNLSQELTKEWLYQKYIVEGLTMVDIGKIVDRDPKTIFYWMRKFDIPTRPRGSYEAVYFKKDDPRSFSGNKHSEITKRKISEKSKGKKPYLRNGEHWLHTVKPEENPNWKGGITPERQTLYRSQEWKDIIQEILERDKYTCQLCKRNFKNNVTELVNRRKLHIHHIVNFEVEKLRIDKNNLVLLCSKCHRFVHGKKNVERVFIADIPPEKTNV